jgi:multicomponent Na+:H+ antiporter subunit B
MSRKARTVLYAVGCLGLAIAFVLAAFGLPGFGGDWHPYRDAAISVSWQHMTANAVSSVNFDQRALDTFGEETILLAAVVGAATALRPGARERRGRPADLARPLPVTRLAGYLMLPVTLMIGLDVVAHGHLTPGGGFQGGVVLATGVHLLYIAGSYPALRRVRPLAWYEWGEAVGVGVFAVFGIVTVVVSTVFLANILPLGSLGALASAGAVPLLNAAVGIEVVSGVIVLLAQFLEAPHARSLPS